jgi:lipid-A-disaccharide synthase
MAFSQKPSIKIFLSAGEASGDLHAAGLVRAIKSIAPSSKITCLGGPQLKQAGASVLVDNRDMAVVGLFEVFRHAKVIWCAWRKIKRHLVQERPDLLILIDFPDFNFLLARQAHRLGIKVLYYIPPQIWAWRRGRVHTLKRLVDEMVVILPFEEEFYRRYGVQAHFLGHPLLDVVEAAREEREGRYRTRSTGPFVGLLPGSRHSEIRSLLPEMLKTASLLIRRLPEISFLLPVAPTLDSRAFEMEVLRSGLPVRLVEGDTYGVIRGCDLVITASGTVTLETAILGVPMIIVYKVSHFSYYLGRHLIKVKHVGLPNLIAGRGIVPELLQHEATAERIAAEALEMLLDPKKLDAQRQELAKIRSHLGEPGVGARVAGLVMLMKTEKLKDQPC